MVFIGKRGQGLKINKSELSTDIPGPQFHRVALAQKVAKHNKIKNKVISKTALSHAQSLTGILLDFAKRKIVKQNCLLKSSSTKLGPGCKKQGSNLIKLLY